MDATSFWREARRRRNLFFVVFPTWLIVGFPLFGFYSWVLPTSEPMIAMAAALFTWGGVMQWTLWRLRALRCFRCGESALRHPYFTMSSAKCRHCGVRARDA